MHCSVCKWLHARLYSTLSARYVIVQACTGSRSPFRPTNCEDSEVAVENIEYISENCHGPETLICLYPVAPQLSPLAINVALFTKSTSSFPSARFTSLFLPSYRARAPTSRHINIMVASNPTTTRGAIDKGAKHYPP